MLADAFNSLLSINGNMVTLKRPGGGEGGADLTVTVRMSMSNYSRNLDTVSETVVKGREYVVSKIALTKAGFNLRPKRADRIIDGEMGTLIVNEVRECSDVGGAIIGYRLLTG